MCNCNSSFCNICCRRVKAYRFDDVPEITGDLQLYTEFYKVGEAYGHWKFTIDDLEAYLDIPTVLWSDKLVAFGHTATGGLFYQSDFRFDYTTSSLTVGTRGVGLEGLYSASFGNNIVGDSSLAVGDLNDIGASSFAIGSGNFGGSNNIFLFGDSNSSNQRNATIFGDNNMSSQQKINIFGYNLTASHGGNAMLSDATGGSSSIADDAFTAQFAGGYRFRLDASSTAVNISSTGIVTIDNVVNNNTEDQLLVWNVTTKDVEYRDVSSLPYGTGTITDIIAGDGMDFTTVTSGAATIDMGTPSTITLASVNGASGTTHSHDFDLGGSAGQYLAGDNTLQTFPTIPTVTPAALTKTDDTNVTLTLGGTPATALLQATSITVGWSGTLSVSRGGSGAGTFTAGYLKANGTSAFTTVATIPYTDITGTPTIPTVYWSRTGTVLSPLNAGDTVTITKTTNAAINELLKLDNGGTGAAGTQIGFYNTTLRGWIQNHYVASPAGYYTDLYGQEYVRLVTSSDGGTTKNTVLQSDASGLILIPNLAGSGTRMVVANAAGALSTSTYVDPTGKYVALSDADAAYESAISGVSANSYRKNSELYGNNITGDPGAHYGHLKTFGGIAGSFAWQLWKDVYDSDTLYFRTDGGSGYGSWYHLASRAWVTANFTNNTGTVTGVNKGNGMNFSNFTTSGTITLGTPSDVSLTSTSTLTTNSHSHAFTPGGSGTTQYITGLGTLATNMWTDTGSYLMPTGGDNIRTNNTAGTGWVHLLVGDATHTGRLELYNHLSAQIGFIGYYEDRMCYFAGIGYHSFEQLPVRIQSVATDNALTDFAVYGTGNELKKRTLASLTGLPSSVWNVQGGSTAATTTTQDIWHNGKVRVGNSTSSAYMLSVSGTGYFTSTVDFNNNVGIQGFTTGAVIKNLIKLDSSNRTSIGVSGTDIILPAYPNSRNDAAVPSNYLYTDSSGVMKSGPTSDIVGSFAQTGSAGTQAITANSTFVQITTTTSTLQRLSVPSIYTIVSDNIVIGTEAKHRGIDVDFDWVTTAGTSGNVSFELRVKVNGTIISAIRKVEHTAIKGTFHTKVADALAGGGAVTVEIRCITGSAGITINYPTIIVRDYGFY